MSTLDDIRSALITAANEFEACPESWDPNGVKILAALDDVTDQLQSLKGE